MRFSLLLELARRDFSERYAGSVLGMLWALLLPLVMIFIYTVIFARVMGAKLPGIGSAYSYGIYLIAGTLPWNAFANTVSRCAGLFSDRKGIISKVPVSLASLPLYIVLAESVTFVLSLGIYVLFLSFSGIRLPGAIFWVPFILAVQQIFAYALGLLLATFSVFLRDLREVIGIVIQLWFWFTPIVYTPAILPERLKPLLLWNPAYLFVSAYQDIFFHGVVPNSLHLVSLTVLGHGLLLLALRVLRGLEKDVRDFL